MSSDKSIGILDPAGLQLNPLTTEPYSDTYKSIAKIWSKYPAYAKRADVLESIAENQLTFIISGTGSGKTVLIPKFALHHTNYKGKVIVTLPKRIAALSSATYAATTLDVELGGPVGYLYKGSPKEMINNSNVIQYVTDGSLIMKIIADPLLSEYNVVIIDEAHERKIQIDLLLLILKQIMLKRADLRVIIMSATIDGQRYQKYFDGVTSKIINISGQPNHPIDVKFLPTESKSYVADGLNILYKLIESPKKEDTLFFITSGNEAMQLCSSIRPKYPKVFCIEVFSDMDDKLKSYAESRDKYSELGDFDQKIVFATNVAESSVTIDGLKCVIDSGYELYSYYDPDRMMNVLEKKLVTKAQAIQRRGRVGRTEPGTCYHLMTAEQFEQLDPYPKPDILKQDITMDLIKVTQLTSDRHLESGLRLMNQLMDPPTTQQINSAIDILRLYKIVDESNVLTKIATDVMKFSSTPLNLSLFMIYAYQLYCAKEACIIVAAIEKLNGKISNLFYKLDSDCNIKKNKKLIADLVMKKGDHFTLLNIIEKYREVVDKKAFANKHGLKLNKLSEINQTASNYYFKLIGLMRAPQIAGADKRDTKKNIISALKMSHLHLIANKNKTTYPKKKTEGQINKDSSIWINHDKSDISNKKFIYNELVSNNGSIEYSVITLIK